MSIFLCIYFFLNFSSYLLKYLLLYKCHPVSPLGVYIVGSVLGYGDPFTSWWVRNAASTNGKNSCPVANYFPCLVIIRDDRIIMVKGSVHVQNGSVLQKQLLSFPTIIPAAEGVPPGTHVQYITCLHLLGEHDYEGTRDNMPFPSCVRRCLVNARAQSRSTSPQQ